MAEWLTKATIWVVIACYGLVIGRPDSHSLGRFAWTLGLIAFVAHMMLAFATYYQWSWSLAWQATADDAERFTGVRAGWGLWLNLLFGLVWGLLTWRYWAIPSPGNSKGSGEREAGPTTWPRWTVAALHGFLLFMVLMGGIAFAPAPARIFSAVVLVCALASLLVSIRRSRATPTEDR